MSFPEVFLTADDEAVTADCADSHRLLKGITGCGEK
jgi:hypothetical protein